MMSSRSTRKILKTIRCGTLYYYAILLPCEVVINAYTDADVCVKVTTKDHISHLNGTIHCWCHGNTGAV